jgi:hypothetical protein
MQEIKSHLRSAFLCAAGAVALLTGRDVFAGPYSGIAETAEALPTAHWQVGFEPFIAFNGGGMFNAILHLNYGLDESIELKSVLGTGGAEAQLGAGAKWNILPDVEGQVAVSVSVWAKYIHDGQNIFLIEGYPEVSKRFDVSGWKLTPYGAFQVDGLFAKGASTVPLNVSFGSRVTPAGWQTVSFLGEFGISFHRSSHYLSLQVVADLDNLFEWNKDRLP